MSPRPAPHPQSDPSVSPGLIVEVVGDELLICTPDTFEVHRLAGPARRAFEAVAAGATADDEPAVRALEALGLVRAPAPGRGISRRQVLVGAATTVGAVGIATMVLPQAAAAASTFTGGSGEPATPPVDETTTTTAQPTTTTAQPTTTTSTTTTAPPTTTTTAAPTTTTTTTAPGGTLNGGGTVTGLGTFVDSGKGVTLVRTAGSVALNISANWEYVEITGPATNRVTKTGGSSTVGYLTRVDNKNVTVNLSSSVTYSITIKWNGSSTGSTYLIRAV